LSGKVIKTIGDEVMCCFNAADQAFTAAMMMQRAVSDDNSLSQHKIALRIGFNSGTVIEDADDVFGDNVNIAARVAGLAKAGQILTTVETIKQLSPLSQSQARPFSLTAVKGKQEQLEVWEVLWNEDATMLVRSVLSTGLKKKLLLTYDQKQFELLPKEGSSLSVGRSQQADIIVGGQSVSRLHAKLFFSKNKFLLSDTSYNGTYVQTKGKVEYLHGQETPLGDEGILSFGSSFNDENQHWVHFSIQPLADGEA
jgi:glutamate 5-kinase